LNDNKALKEITWKRIQTIGYLEPIVKVRVDHIGRIVAVGEY
jgi:CRISPR-associated endonuclease Csn1